MQAELKFCGCRAVGVNRYPGCVNAIVIEISSGVCSAIPQPGSGEGLFILWVWAKGRSHRLNWRSAGDVKVARAIKTVLQASGNVIGPAVGFLQDNPEPKNSIGVDRKVFAVAGSHERGGRLGTIVIAEPVSLLDSNGRAAAVDRLDHESVWPRPIEYAVFLAY